MNLRKRTRVSAEVNTSALNDIMFFLLLFFLIASTVVNPNVIKLLLPKSSTGQAVSKKTITVSVTSDLKYYVEKQEVSQEELPNMLKSYLEGLEELTVVLYCDKTVAIENVVNVMDVSNKLKIKLVLATEKK
jgi:biopolymer transport protein ExbD